MLLPFFTCFPKGCPLGQVYEPSTDLYVSKSWTHWSSRSFLERARCVRLISPIFLLLEGKPTFPPDLLVCLAVSPQVKSISVGFRLSKENGPIDSPQIFPIPFALLYIIWDIFFLGLIISTRLSKEPPGRCYHKSTLESPEWLLSETELRVWSHNVQSLL